MRFAIADTETAGLTGGVCDFAMVEVDENLNVVETWESLIDPEMKISPEAMGVHHITDEMVWDKPTLSEYMDMVGHPLQVDDLVMSGHNIQFDCRMLHSVLPETYRKVCTLKLARNLYPDLESHKLQTIRYTYGLEAGPAHRAMGDVITCLSFLRKIAADKGIGLEGLIALGHKPLTGEFKLPFGKHRGTKLKDLPKSYINWMLGQDFDPEIVQAIKAL